MRKIMFAVAALSVGFGVGTAGCGSGAGQQQSSSGAGTGGTVTAPAAGAGAGGAGLSGGGSGYTSGGSAMSIGASGAGADAEAGAGAGGPANLYVDQLRTNAPSACLPRALPFGTSGGPNEGRVSCTIGELHPSACDCAQAGRAALAANVLAAFKKSAEATQWCGGASGVDCAAVCGCELVQLPGTSVESASDLYACQNDVTPPAELAGFCVIDIAHLDASGAAPIGSPALVASCPSSSRRRIRFVGPGASADAATFIACSG